MNSDSTIYVSSPSSLIGAAIVRRLGERGHTNVVGPPAADAHLRDADVAEAFAAHAPEYVFVVGGKSGGIGANQRLPADLMFDNLSMALRTVDAAWRHGAKKLLYVASSCVYPKLSAQPMAPASLLAGPLEPTNESYALAKIAGLKLCEAYRRQYGANFVGAIPADPFGPGANFSLEDSHVVAALIRKMHEAKASGAGEILLWGTGTPRREFMFCDDLADACIFAIEHYDGAEPINLGGGADLAIAELAAVVQRVVGYDGDVRFDASKPDGMPRKLLDSTVLRTLGWRPRANLDAALAATYEGFLRSEWATPGREPSRDEIWPRAGKAAQTE